MKLPGERTFRGGVSQILEHPQLWLTVVLAVSIVASFVYVANRFITIARDAQDRLVNVRVGSLQDAFVPLAAAFIDDKAMLDRSIRDVALRNPTIAEFVIMRESAGAWTVTNALDERQVGQQVLGQGFLISIAKADTSNSFTIEEVQSGERYFRTARAITNGSSTILGVVLTKQRLSEADRAIASSIQSSIIVLVGILALLLFLFFHHARIIDYTALYKRLKEVDTLKDDFISMVSHELRTPLTVIRGYIAELQQPTGSLPREELLKRVDQGAQSLNALVADMLDVARIEQGRMPMKMDVIDPNEIVASVCESLRAAATAKKLSLGYFCAPGIRIQADPDRLRQILTNLVNNAIKYSDRGSVSVYAYITDRAMALHVSDTGIGMSAEDQARLFSKFNRASGERVRKEIGTGLGLWITKQLIEAMGGRISVESIKDVGSHFIVRFPLAGGEK